MGKIAISKKWLKNNFNEFSLGLLSDIGSGFLKNRFFAEFELRKTIDIKTSGFMSINAFLIDKEMPKQYSNFIFGSVDPDFTKLVINRTSQNNDLKILQNTFHGWNKGN